ncbi:MAG TPA: hypothetical protein DC024_04185 [Clostridiales bacterium]|jgi:hypothetical protein|nr:hypothetical protein [Clostridiales bacterium]
MSRYGIGSKVKLNSQKSLTIEERARLSCAGIRKGYEYEVEKYVPAPWCNLILKDAMSWWPADWFEPVEVA